MTATGCRASRRGAPGPQGALRPLGLRSDAGIRRFGLALAARRGDASRRRLPTPLRSRRPHPANGCIRSLAHGRDHSAASRAAGSRSGISNAPSGSPSEALRSPSRWAGKIRIPLHGIILPPSRAGRRTTRYGSLPPGDGPLATARSHRKASMRSFLLMCGRMRQKSVRGGSCGFGAIKCFAL